MSLLIIQGPENTAFLINIHEPIIWRLHEMIQHVNFNRLYDNQTYDNQTTAVAVDPIIQIGYVRSYIKLAIECSMPLPFQFK